MPIGFAAAVLIGAVDVQPGMLTTLGDLIRDPRITLVWLALTAAIGIPLFSYALSRYEKR